MPYFYSGGRYWGSNQWPLPCEGLEANIVGFSLTDSFGRLESVHRVSAANRCRNWC
jgi:hypothetical protein